MFSVGYLPAMTTWYGHNIQNKDILSFEPLYNISTRMLQYACYFLGFPFIAVFVDAWIRECNEQTYTYIHMNTIKYLYSFDIIIRGKTDQRNPQK